MMISAQETTPGHAFSNAAFASSMMSYPRTLRFGMAVFSDELPSNSIDASHPFLYNNKPYISPCMNKI